MAAGITTSKSPPQNLLCISLNKSTNNLTPPQTLKPSSKCDFHGFKIVLPSSSQRKLMNKTGGTLLPVEMSVLIGKAHKWWGKGVQQNMKEINGAQDLVDSLLKAGDQLVIVDFFSPGCGGCKALHPKICQFAEMNPDIQVLQVSHEEHKSLCYSLNVHVLPFFRFYRGAHGRLCSFSCTNATIKKFKDALAKHTTERCSLGPTKGLEEAELLALAANISLSFKYTPKPEPTPTPTPVLQEPLPANNKEYHTLPSTSSRPIKESKEKTLATAVGS